MGKKIIELEDKKLSKEVSELIEDMGLYGDKLYDYDFDKDSLKKFKSFLEKRAKASDKLYDWIDSNFKTKEETLVLLSLAFQHMHNLVLEDDGDELKMLILGLIKKDQNLVNESNKRNKKLMEVLERFENIHFLSLINYLESTKIVE